MRRRLRFLLAATALALLVLVPTASSAQCWDPAPMKLKGRTLMDLRRVCYPDNPLLERVREAIGDVLPGDRSFGKEADR